MQGVGRKLDWDCLKKALSAYSRRQSRYHRVAVNGRLLSLHVKAEQNILVAYVEFAIGDDRRCPTVFVSTLRLVETAELLPAISRGFDKRNSPLLLLVAEVQATIGVDNRALSDLALFLPFSRTGLKILASPAFAVRKAIHFT